MRRVRTAFVQTLLQLADGGPEQLGRLAQPHVTGRREFAVMQKRQHVRGRVVVGAEDVHVGRGRGRVRVADPPLQLALRELGLGRSDEADVRMTSAMDASVKADVHRRERVAEHRVDETAKRDALPPGAGEDPLLARRRARVLQRGGEIAGEFLLALAAIRVLVTQGAVCGVKGRFADVFFPRGPSTVFPPLRLSAF